MTRYLADAGFSVRSVQRKFSDGRSETKYRLVELLADRPAPGSGRVKATLALLLPEGKAIDGDFAKRQARCDSVLLSVLARAAAFSQIELVQSPVCFGLTAQREAQE